MREPEPPQLHLPRFRKHCASRPFSGAVKDVPIICHPRLLHEWRWRFHTDAPAKAQMAKEWILRHATTTAGSDFCVGLAWIHCTVKIIGIFSIKISERLQGLVLGVRFMISQDMAGFDPDLSDEKRNAYFQLHSALYP